MISRYEEKDISLIWADEFKFMTYLKVELAILKAQEGKKIPIGTAAKIANVAKINPKRIAKIEKITKHDIIAFCSSITEQIKDESISKFFHFGVTSSDIVDTTTNLQIKESLKFIDNALVSLSRTLFKIAKRHQYTITLGRSHGMFAEPMSFGAKFLSSYAEFRRHLDDLRAYIKNDLTAQFSGAVGNYTVLTPAEESRAAKTLGLKVEPISSQVIPRDRIAKLINITSLIASAIERIAVEIRHLHRSDVAEVHEGFSKGQKGSSTMPHKKNPIATENLTGMARLIRSHLSIAYENIILWHERDISHSSAERVYLPDHLGLLLYAIKRLETTLCSLVIHKDKIEEKVKNNDSYLSSYYLHKMLSKEKITREEAYKKVQTLAFTGKMQTDNKIELNSIREIYLRHTDKIFKRVLKIYPLVKKC